jgi:hypothetical protein
MSAPGMGFSEIVERLDKLDRAVQRQGKDPWDKVQIAATVVSTLVIGALGIWIPMKLEEQQHHSQLHQAVAQIETARETADTEIRARVFEVLISQFFRELVPAPGVTPPASRPVVRTDGTGGGKKLILLSLLENNFQEFLNTRPLFEMVNDELNPEEKLKLRHLAANIAEKQELRLGAALVDHIQFVVGRPKEIDVGDLKLSLTLEEVGAERVKVRVQAVKDQSKLQFRSVGFHVTFFDTPFMDSTILPDGHRFAVTLKNVYPEKNAADLKIFEFSHDFLAAQGRPALSQLQRSLERVVESSEMGREHLASMN